MTQYTTTCFHILQRELKPTPLKIHQRGVQWKQGVVVYTKLLLLLLVTNYCLDVYAYKHITISSSSSSRSNSSR